MREFNRIIKSARMYINNKKPHTHTIYEYNVYIRKLYNALVPAVYIRIIMRCGYYTFIYVGKTRRTANDLRSASAGRLCREYSKKVCLGRFRVCWFYTFTYCALACCAYYVIRAGYDSRDTHSLFLSHTLSFCRTARCT